MVFGCSEPRGSRRRLNSIVRRNSPKFDSFFGGPLTDKKFCKAEARQRRSIFEFSFFLPFSSSFISFSFRKLKRIKKEGSALQEMGALASRLRSCSSIRYQSCFRTTRYDRTRFHLGTSNGFVFAVFSTRNRMILHSRVRATRWLSVRKNLSKNRRNTGKFTIAAAKTTDIVRLAYLRDRRRY